MRHFFYDAHPTCDHQAIAPAKPTATTRHAAPLPLGSDLSCLPDTQSSSPSTIVNNGLSSHSRASIVRLFMSRTLKIPPSLDTKLCKDLTRGLKIYPPRSIRPRSALNNHLLRYRHGGKLWISRAASRPGVCKYISTSAAPTLKETLSDPPQNVALPPSKLELDLLSNQASYLQYVRDQHRISGHAGIRAAWRAFRQANIDLPTDEGAIDLWALFLRVPGLRDEVLQYALQLKERTGRVLESLYTLFMSRFICSGTTVSKEVLLDYHNTFLKNYLVPPSAMEELARYVPVSTMALDAYYYLYVQSNTRGSKVMYDSIVSTLCRHREWHLAFHFHRALTNSGIQVESNPIVDELESNPSLKEAIYNHLWSLSFNKGAKDPLEAVALSDIEVQPQGPITDEFCARLFATKTFPISLIMAGLRMCKVKKIGPLSLREFLARASSISDASDYLNLLHYSRIRSGTSTYARAITRILATNQFPLLRNFLECDLHPDTFDDIEIQRKLLQHYLAEGELLSAKRTSIILALLHERQSGRNSPWTGMLRSFCQKRNIARLSVLVDDMVLGGLPLDPAANGLLAHYFYPKNIRTQPSFDERNVLLPFAANIKILHLRCGMVPPINNFVSDLMTNGKLGHWDQVTRMISFMAFTLCQGSQLPEARYFKTVVMDAPNIAASLQRCLPSGHVFKADTKMFGFKALRAIISWGFKRGRNNLVSLRSRRSGAKVVLLGLACLKHLARIGVEIQPTDIAELLRWRLWILYGFHTLKGRDNIISRHLVPFGLEDLLFSVNAIWPLHELFPELFSGKTVDATEKECLLDGLLQQTTKDGAELSREERMRKRIRLREEIYGFAPSNLHHTTAGRHVAEREWHQWIYSDAKRADDRYLSGGFGDHLGVHYA